MIEIGIGTGTTIYDGILDENIRVNTACEYVQEGRYIKEYYGSLVYDDKSIYDYLINELEKEKNIYKAIYNATINYLFLFHIDRKFNDYEKTRKIVYHQYSSTMNKSISIELFHRNKTAMCLETAGLVHNYFKYLGMESDFVLYGKLKNDSEGNHAFNIIYPHGKDKEAILFDLSNTSVRKPLIAMLGDKQKDLLLSNKEISIKKEEIENTYKEIFNEDFKWKNEEERYFIFKDGYPETVIKDKKPFTIVRDLKFKR